MFGCVYGECYKTMTFGPLPEGAERTPVGRGGRWVRGRDRTARRCMQLNHDWLADTGGNEKELQTYKGCKMLPIQVYRQDTKYIYLVANATPLEGTTTHT